ncbi:hypothetical protein [Vibrio vulnificus]|uniref:hypothetical protein n=1 Tax=Vibrio vulnificus TaxID=672 RepID=UPI003EDAEEAE
MNNTQYINEFRENNALMQLRGRIQEAKDLAQLEFDALVEDGRIKGNWNDNVWQYLGRSLYFRGSYDCDGKTITAHTKIENSVLIQGCWGDIYRLYALSKIKSHKSSNPRVIPGLLSRVIWLGSYLKFDDKALLSINQNTLDNMIPELKATYSKPRGVFERYKDSVSFVKNFVIKKGFCAVFVPKVNMLNPLIERVDPTNKANEEAKSEKYVDDIGKYFGQVKQKFDAAKALKDAGGEPEYFECKDGYDELRLLATPFMQGLGLRVGEVCRLPENCLGYDAERERYFLRTFFEKGQLAFAKSIPKIWERVIVDSYQRIIELTQSHRDFALKVEKQGSKAFLDELEFPNRSNSINKALEDAGYSPDMYFFASELNEYGKEHPSGFTYGGLRSKAYEKAVVGRIKTKFEGEERSQRRKVYSKSLIAQMCLEQWQQKKRDVFNANDDVVASTEIVSTAYTVHMPFSKFLFIAKEDTFDASTATQGIVPCPLTYRSYFRWVNKDNNTRSRTIFQNYNIYDETGDLVTLTPHQIRHWVTTALIRSGKNESAIDLWMGRTIGQARHYDHRTPKERAEELRKRYMSDNPPDDVLGRRIRRMRSNEVSVDEIEVALNHTMSAVHYTPWGTCNRDLDVSPCQKGMVCLRGNNGETCSHFGIDVNDKEALVNIHNTKVHYENQLTVLLPNYDNLSERLNHQEPLDQHVQFCIDTVNGCLAAIKAYEENSKHESKEIPIVQVFIPEDMNE